MIRRFVTLSLGICLCTAALLTAGCESTSRVTWQADGQPYHVRGEQEWWHYQYIYYPTTQVYFEPYTQDFYWFEDGFWRQGTELPAHLKPTNLNSARVVRLEGDTPWAQHGTVVAWHPCEQTMLKDRHNPLVDDQPDWRMAQFED